ncbi:MAG: formate dehydrogenase subunit gamma [bacterium]
MSHHLVKRFSSKERLVHWTNMCTFIVLTLTGLGLYSQTFFGLTSIFGGVDMSRVIHHYAGLVFIATTFLIFFQWVKDFTAAGEDSLGDVISSYMDHDYESPPSGKLNAGQKLLGFIVFTFGVIMGLTGIFMWFPDLLGRGIQQWMYFLHNFVFILFMLLILLHVYLGTAASPGTWRGMSKGTVTKAWAKKHHGAWDGEEL